MAGNKSYGQISMTTRDKREIVQREINDVINPLLKSWDKKTEEEVEALLRQLGRIARDETSLLRNEALSNISLAEELVKIGEKYGKNTVVLREIVSSINNMYARYKLVINEEVFNFLMNQTKNKQINFYVSLFITELSQFEKYADKWAYIVSIPRIAPKSKSMNTFFRVISGKVNDIPNQLRLEIIKILEEHAKKENLHQSTVDKYLGLVKALKN